MFLFVCFWVFFFSFFFPFKPRSPIKLDTIHHWQETLEGAVCRVEQRPRALHISLPSLPLALTHGLAGGESPPCSAPPGETVAYLVGLLCYLSYLGPGT